MKILSKITYEYSRFSKSKNLIRIDVAFKYKVVQRKGLIDSSVVAVIGTISKDIVDPSDIDVFKFEWFDDEIDIFNIPIDGKKGETILERWQRYVENSNQYLTWNARWLKWKMEKYQTTPLL